MYRASKHELLQLQYCARTVTWAWRSSDVPGLQRLLHTPDVLWVERLAISELLCLNCDPLVCLRSRRAILLLASQRFSHPNSRVLRLAQ